MRIFKTSAALVLSAVVLASCTSYSAQVIAPAKIVDGVLAGSNGMTLYTFDRDVPGDGKSVCNGPCTSNWPPLFVSDNETPRGDYSIVVRDDGRKQWAYKGRPLYFWSKDQKPGDKTGDGFNNVWRVAKP